MRKPAKALWILALLTVAAVSSIAGAGAASADDHRSMVIVFKDGHRQNLDVADISRIEFKSPSMIVFKDGHRPSIPAATR